MAYEKKNEFLTHETLFIITISYSKYYYLVIFIALVNNEQCLNPWRTKAEPQSSSKKNPGKTEFANESTSTRIFEQHEQINVPWWSFGKTLGHWFCGCGFNSV